MSTDFCNFWHSDTVINFQQKLRYVQPTAPNVCSYSTLAKMNCQISACSTTDTGVISTKLFFGLKPNFDIFTLEENIKICMLHFGIISTSEFLCLATGAIKAVVHTVNMKFRKLRRIMSEIKLTNLVNLEVLELSCMGIHANVQRWDREQNKFCGNLTIYFHQGSVGTHKARRAVHTSYC